MRLQGFAMCALSTMRFSCLPKMDVHLDFVGLGRSIPLPLSMVVASM